MSGCIEALIVSTFDSIANVALITLVLGRLLTYWPFNHTDSVQEALREDIWGEESSEKSTIKQDVEAFCQSEEDFSSAVTSLF